MLPIILSPAELAVGLAGEAEALERRRAFLAEAGVTPIAISADNVATLATLRVLFVAGLDRKASEKLARQAQAQGVLVNTEDQPDLCDFHVPAVVRRGDLLLTVSSAGRSPGLVKMIREWLAARFGAEWSGRLKEVGRNRDAWRAQNVPVADVSQKTRAMAAEWLP